MPTSSVPNKYAIEIRDKSFRLKQRVEHLATNVQWEWNRFGGCGRATFTVPGNYLRFQVNADDDVRIFLPNTDGLTATLWYRGYVESATPSLEGSAFGNIKIECAGYFNWLDRIIIQNANTPKTYSSSEISAVVTDIVNNFIVPNSSIVSGTIDASNFTPDELLFKTTARDAISTLFDLAGAIECGVDVNLNFFWRNQSNAIAQEFFVGDKVIKISEKINFRDIVNKIYFEGGDVSGTPFLATSSSDDSVARYGLHEQIIQNASIVTLNVANQYMASILTQKSKPQRQLDVSLKNIETRFESNQPMGNISVIDRDATQSASKWGKAASGGSNKIYGRKITGGSDALYGGKRKDQIERVVYTLSPQDGRVHAELSLGVSIAFSRASSEIKRIELIQNTIRQRQLA